VLEPERPACDRRREEQDRQRPRERVRQVATEMDHRLQLDPPRVRAAQQRGKHLPGRLYAALGPPSLLHLERADRGRDLGTDRDIVQKDESPARHLCPVAEVEVLGQRIRLPTPGLGHAIPPPHARSAVEVEEASTHVSPALLVQEVAVEVERLCVRKPVLVAVQVIPAGLHHPDRWVTERREKLPDQVRVGHEVRVQDEQEFASGTGGAVGERARLEASPFRTPQVLNPSAPAAPVSGPCLGDP